jgi:hypothetical protein
MRAVTGVIASADPNRAETITRSVEDAPKPVSTLANLVRNLVQSESSRTAWAVMPCYRAPYARCVPRPGHLCGVMPSHGTVAMSHGKEKLNERRITEVAPEWMICVRAVADRRPSQAARNRRSDFLPKRWESFTVVVDQAQRTVTEYPRQRIDMRADEILMSAMPVSPRAAVVSRRPRPWPVPARKSP